jgi:hypothetical protein
MFCLGFAHVCNNMERIHVNVFHLFTVFYEVIARLLEVLIYVVNYVVNYVINYVFNSLLSKTFFIGQICPSQSANYSLKMRFFRITPVFLS